MSLKTRVCFECHELRKIVYVDPVDRRRSTTSTWGPVTRRWPCWPTTEALGRAARCIRVSSWTGPIPSRVAVPAPAGPAVPGRSP
jgi:hypothetical protein